VQTRWSPCCGTAGLGVDGYRLSAPLPDSRGRYALEASTRPTRTCGGYEPRSTSFPDRTCGVAETGRPRPRCTSATRKPDGCHGALHLVDATDLLSMPGRATWVPACCQFPEHPGRLPVGLFLRTATRWHWTQWTRGPRVPAERVRAVAAHVTRTASGAASPAAQRDREIELCMAMVLSCRARRSCTTATRSAWATTYAARVAWRCVRRCTGRRAQRRVLHVRAGGPGRADPAELDVRYPVANVRPSAARRTRCSARSAG